jgi:hypothetical protein
VLLLLHFLCCTLLPHLLPCQLRFGQRKWFRCLGFLCLLLLQQITGAQVRSA